MNCWRLPMTTSERERMNANHPVRLSHAPMARACRVVVAAVVALLAATAHAKTLKIATVSPDGSSWMKILRQAGADLDVATNGRVKIKYYPGGGMGDDASVLKRMRIGQLHGGLVLTTAFATIYPDI